MLDELSKKLNDNKNSSFEDKEVSWMLENIGNTDPNIRDKLIYNLLASGLINNQFTLQQFNMICRYIIDNQLLFYNIKKLLPATLTRSFTSLICGVLLHVDNNHTSLYYRCLSKKDKFYLFKSAISYLQNEKDKIGYSEKYGWVHAFAHGGDYLSEAISHTDFPNVFVSDVLHTIKKIISEIKEPFIDEEEKRIGNIIVQGLMKQVIDQKELLLWIKSFEFDFNNRYAYYQNMMQKSLLAFVYFHTLDIKLNKDLEKELIKQLKNY